MTRDDTRRHETTRGLVHAPPYAVHPFHRTKPQPPTLTMSNVYCCVSFSIRKPAASSSTEGTSMRVFSASSSLKSLSRFPMLAKALASA